MERDGMDRRRDGDWDESGCTHVGLWKDYLQRQVWLPSCLVPSDAVYDPSEQGNGSLNGPQLKRNSDKMVVLSISNCHPPEFKHGLSRSRDNRVSNVYISECYQLPGNQTVMFKMSCKYHTGTIIITSLLKKRMHLKCSLSTLHFQTISVLFVRKATIPKALLKIVLPLY